MRPRRYVLMITAPILATSVVLLVVGAAAAWYVHQLNQEVSNLLSHNLKCTVASQHLVLGIRDARTEMHRFLDGGDEDNLRSGRDRAGNVSAPARRGAGRNHGRYPRSDRPDSTQPRPVLYAVRRRHAGHALGRAAAEGRAICCRRSRTMSFRPPKHCWKQQGKPRLNIPCATGP